MAVCTRCGQENPDGFRFCGSCGAELDTAPRSVREERKVVSVVFCDLVGFTATAQAADPEDVSRMLGAYHASVRVEIERFGGAVEKFIGDAAVGVWGVPVAHEDDAERAVRAALAILDVVEADVRVAVNTGEALARLGQSPDAGARAVGDVINTAARLQAAAPVGEILVGEGTVRATGDAVAYRPTAPLTLKGKPSPVPAWVVVAARPREAEEELRSTTPFLGRDRELSLLRDVFERALAERSVQLVTITGEPGIGKSRLVVEFTAWLAAHEHGAVARRGRCLSYGDGIGFWPLAEIIKSELGITETDGEDAAAARLSAAVSGMPDAPWIRARLAPLIGLPGEGGEREEVFGAWQTFFDVIADERPLILIFEDIHWADPGMLEFIGHLVEWSTGVCIVVVCTSRPELFEAHPHWAGGLTNATTLSLRPLTAEETRPLVDSLLAESQAAGAIDAIVDRCGGNPLYAQEYARLLTDAGAHAIAQFEMPDTIQAVIAARIDTLDRDRKALLQDAAVVGKVFWAGAVAAITERDIIDVRREFHDLSRKELVRRSRSSSLPGDEEYAFWHDLVHDVTYRQIPRAHRAQQHRRTAEWIEAAAGDRLADRAELIAHHYTQALELTAALNNGRDTEPLRRAAVKYLTLAGEQAVGLDRPHAERLLSSAERLATTEDPESTRILNLLTQCAMLEGELDRAYRLADEARTAAAAAGDQVGLCEAFVAALQAALLAGDRPTVDALTAQGLDVLDPDEAATEFAQFLVWAGTGQMLRERWEASERTLRRAIHGARLVGDRHTEALGRNMLGVVRSMTGDRGGLEDLEQSAETLREVGSPSAAVGLYQVADQRLIWDGPCVAAPLFAEAVAYAHRTRNVSAEMWARGENVWRLADEGAWDELLREADAVLAWAEQHSSAQHGLLVAPNKARVLALRSDVSAARSVSDAILERARRTKDVQVLAPTLAAAALIEYVSDDWTRAHELLIELGAGARSSLAPTAEICRMLTAVGDKQRAQATVDGIQSGPPRLQNAVPSIRGTLAESRCAYREAADHYQTAANGWRTYGHPFELAHALAGTGRCFTSLGRPDEALSPQAEATSLFQSLGIPDRTVTILTPSARNHAV